MKRDEMVLGEPYVVEAPWHEWAAGFGTPLVKAVVREVRVTYPRAGFTTGVKTDGVACELLAPIRTYAAGGHGVFETREPGELFVVPSRGVLRPSGKVDDLREEGRAHRYADQDFVLATMEQRGLPITERAVVRGVSFELAPFARWLKRVDPVDIAREAIVFVTNAAAQTQEEHEEAVAAALEEVRQGLAVSDAELAASRAPEPEVGL